MLKPILLGVEGQSREIVEQYGAGICFEPENQEDFLRKLLVVKNDADLTETFRTDVLDLHMILTGSDWLKRCSITCER